MSPPRDASPVPAEIVHEYIPIDEKRIHGVTFDGVLVWFARDDELIGFDPRTETVVHRHDVPGACAGTAFDGENLYQLTRDGISVVRPSDGKILRRLAIPRRGVESGLAWSDGYLWVGLGPENGIQKIDARTGEVVKTIATDRFVTGVSCVDGALWYGASFDGKPRELRRVASDGAVEEALSVPVESIAGVEGTRDGDFWCAGDKGKLRLVRGRRS